MPRALSAEGRARKRAKAALREVEGAAKKRANGAATMAGGGGKKKTTHEEVMDGVMRSMSEENIIRPKNLKKTKAVGAQTAAQSPSAAAVGGAPVLPAQARAKAEAKAEAEAEAEAKAMAARPKPSLVEVHALATKLRTSEQLDQMRDDDQKVLLAEMKIARADWNLGKRDLRNALKKTTHVAGESATPAHKQKGTMKRVAEGEAEVDSDGSTASL